MAQITGGKVTFKRAFQPEQYGSRGSEAELSFSMAEGDTLEQATQLLDLASKLAQDKVMELVYAKAPAGAKAVVKDLPPHPGVALAAAAEAGLRASTGEKATPEVKVLGALVVAADKATVKEKAAAKMNKVDKELAKLQKEVTKVAAVTAPLEPDPFGPAAISTGEPRVSPDDDLAQALGDAPVSEVPLTPKDCKDAVVKKMAGINNPKAIKAVIAKYITAPQTITDIPVDKRAAFVAEIAALEK
jgi:hypothetical protein